MKRPVLGIGDLNPDILLRGVNKLRFGKEVFAKDGKITLGSSTGIFLARLSELGFKTVLYSAVGKDETGRISIGLLKSHGVRFAGEILPGRTAFTVALISPEGERALLTSQGVLKNWEPDLSKIESLARKASLIHIAGIFIARKINENLHAILQVIHDVRVPVSLDPGWDDEKKFAEVKGAIEEGKLSIFLPNESEAETMYSDWNSEFEKISAEHPQQIIVVKMGSKGARIFFRGRAETFTPHEVIKTPVDTTGAGDSFNAGFIGYLLKENFFSSPHYKANLPYRKNDYTGEAAFSVFKKAFEEGHRSALKALRTIGGI